MAFRIKGRPPGLDQLDYDVYWTEYRSIEETQDVHHDEEEEQMGGAVTCLILVFNDKEVLVIFCWGGV